MSKGIRKTTIREIRGSFGRYMAILLIVGLGVGFFSGLKIAHEVMLHTAELYFDDRNLYDYHLLSTLGFSEDSVRTLSEQENVADAEGGQSLDVLMNLADGSEHAVKLISLPETVNLPQLTAGRMPEKANECLADEHFFDEDAIGSSISLSDGNAEDSEELLKETEYEIVGLCRSPLYSMYDRGTTTVGDGSLDAFVYVMPDAFDMDYLTDIYVVFQKNADATMYSDVYDALIDGKTDAWETLAEQEADERYDAIRADAEEELADARETLNRESKDGEEELNDAKKQIAEGEDEIAEGKQALADAKTQIADSERTLREKQEEYKEGVAKYQKNQKSYQSGKADYETGLAQYESQYAAYETNLAEYEAGVSAYEEAKAAYETGLLAYEEAKTYLSAEERAAKETELAATNAQFVATAGQLAETKAQLDAAGQVFAQTKETLSTTAQQLKSAKEQLAKAKKQLAEAKDQLADGKEQIAQAKEEIASKERTLADAEQELEDAKAEYEDGRQEYLTQISDAQAEIADGQAELDDLEQPEVYVLGRDSNTGYANYENDSGIIDGVAKVFPIFFFLVAALVCMTTMTRMVEEQRTQIGVLKALGYSDAAITGKYMMYSGSAALIGAVLGYFAGTWAFSYVIWTAYKMLYDMGSMHYVFDPALAGISMAVALLCSAGTTYVACMQELRQMAATLMRPKAPKAGKRVLLERMPFVWNRLKFLDKVSVRNLFRYKKRFFMMIIGVSGCTALLIAGLGIRDSIATVAETQFDTISLYDMIVGVTDQYKDDTVDGVELSLAASQSTADASTSEGMKNVTLLVPEQTDRFDRFMDLHTEEGDAVALPGAREAVISEKLANSLQLTVGDTMQIQNADLQGGTVTVSGIYKNYFNHYVLVNAETYEELFGEEPENNVLFVNLSEQADADAVSAAFLKEDGVSTVTVSEKLQETVADMMVSLDYVVILVIFCGAMLAFIVIYNLNNINITERVREIATIKVLGFYREETNSYVFRENMVLTLIGSLLGAGIGHFLHAFIMSQIQIDAIMFDVRVSAKSYAISIVLTLLFNQLVNLFMSGRLEEIDMAESLKSVE